MAITSKTLYIMQGIPASGKSTMAKMIRAQTAGTIISTDDYWYKVTEEGVSYRGGFYNFDIAKLGFAHRWNQKRCEELMDAAGPVIIIDNTNITRKAAQPYVDMAKRHGYDVVVVRVQVDIEEAIKRNATRPADRAIPEDVIRRMASKMEDLYGG